MKNMKVIDAHAHLGEFGGWANVSITAEQMIADMDAFNIVKTVVFMIPNDIVREAVKRYPDRLIGFVWVNPYDGEKAIDEVKRAVNEWGFQGIKLHPLIHAFIPSDEVVLPIMELARDFKIPVLFHSGHPPF